MGLLLVPKWFLNLAKLLKVKRPSTALASHLRRVTHILIPHKFTVPRFCGKIADSNVSTERFNCNKLWNMLMIKRVSWVILWPMSLWDSGVIIWSFVYPLPNPKALRENDAWKAGNAGMEGDGRSYKEGKVRAIGVPNFMQHHLEALMETAEIV